MSYKIRIWQSQVTRDENYNDGYDEDVALNRAEAFIDEAFNRVNHENADVTTSGTYVSTPTEIQNESFESYHPCSTSYRKQYDNLVEWFHDWLDCGFDSVGRVNDCNLLITYGNNPGGGLANTNMTGNGPVAVASTGQHLPLVDSSYVKYGDGTDKYGAPMATLHEVAHNVMEHGTNHHNRGSTRYSSFHSAYTYSPAGSNPDNPNECGEYYGSEEYRQFEYGECATCVMYKNNNVDDSFCNN